MEVIFVFTPRFQLGQLVATPNALEHIPNEEIMAALKRHAQCDWGDLDVEDKKANDHAFAQGGRLFSAYLSTAKVKFWIITEADRSITTVLLPEDY
jgi:hypothetical protein